MLHEVVKKLPGHGGQILSDTPAALQPDQLRYIESRIRAALSGYARPVTEDPGLSITPDLLRGYFDNPSSMVTASQELASLLQNVQPGMSPGGIFIFAQATIDSRAATVIAKLEHENGVRANRQALPGGGTTYVVQLLSDLVFTSAGKIFKVAVFPSPPSSGGRISGWVVDNQFIGPEVAQYFMGRFLGMALTERPEVQTQRLFEAAESWINTVEDPRKKADYQVSLLAEVQRPGETIGVDDFASRYLEVDDRDSFEAALMQSGVQPQPFVKSLTLVENRLRNLRVDTTSGFTVIAPPTALEDGRMTIESEGEGLARITIRDEISQVSGKGRVPS